MDFKHKLLILVIIIVAFIILYRLNRENQEIKKYINQKTQQLNNKKVVEGFEDGSQPISLQSVAQKYMALPLREFIIKSSYNSAISGSTASSDNIRHVLSRGCRVLDFELYSRTNPDSNKTTVYVSQSDDPEYRNIKTDLTLTFADAMNAVAQTAFSGNTPCNADPLFIHLRIKNNSADSYDNITEAILSALDNKMINGEIMSSTLLSNVAGKAVIILDYTSSPKYKKISETQQGKSLESIVNMYSGTLSLPLYDYQEFETLPPTPITIQKDENRTDVRSYIMCYPTKLGGIASLDVKTKPCQMMMTNFSESSGGLDMYEKMFNSGGYAVLPISSIIRKSFNKNSE